MRPVTRRRLLSLACLISGGGFTVAAGIAHAGDIELGRYLSSECTACHRDVKGDGAIPVIHGLDRKQLAEALKAYRAKTRPNPVMQNVAGHLQDNDIEALAAYFATLKKPR